MASSFIDFYVCGPENPRFRNLELIEDDVVRVIIQKYEMILFTNKGEVFGEPNFGGDLHELLHETRLSAESIEADLKNQINLYITEIEDVEYSLQVDFFDDPERHQEIMVIDFNIAGYEVYAVIT